MSSDVNVYRRGVALYRDSTPPEHQLARINPGELHTVARFQDTNCPHCQRVRLDATWYYRCGKCKETVLFSGCAECGGADAARGRYDEHMEVAHGV